MEQLHNGMSATSLPSVVWHKSRLSSPSGNCVELATLPDGAGVAMRNSRDPEGPALIYTRAEVAMFLQAARAGEFDHLLS